MRAFSGYKIPSMSKQTDQLKSLFRDAFLKKQWPPYPDADGLRLKGRVTALHKLYLVISQNVQTKKQLKVPYKKISKAIDWKSILIPGDIIGIKKNGDCVLLAPYLLSDPWEENDIPKKLKRQADWNRFIQTVSAFFTSRDFLTVNTPTLVSNPGPEPTIDVFKTVYKNGRSLQNKFLITSPELHLKKIVSQTLLPVYEITKVFRNNEHSQKHQPEFWMIEWYRPFATLDDIRDDVKDLILFLIKELRLKSKKPKFEFATFQKILLDKHGLNFTPATNAEELKKWLGKKKIYFNETMSLDDLFTLVNLELVETQINQEAVVFLSDYPPYAAALAKIDNTGWAQRFEVYWRDLELGNAFYELNDPEIQERRFIEDNLKKQSNGMEQLPIDEGFMKALRQGLPPTAGIAMGLDRLFMALFQETEIKKTKWFGLH